MGCASYIALEWRFCRRTVVAFDASSRIWRPLRQVPSERNNELWSNKIAVTPTRERISWTSDRRASTERTPSLLAARAAQLGVSPEEAERRDFAPDSPRGNAICRMVDASEVAFVAVFLASEKAWAVSGELVAASGGAGRSVYY